MDEDSHNYNTTWKDDVDSVDSQNFPQILSKRT